MTVAFWCMFAAVLLPYVCFGIARNRGRDAGSQSHCRPRQARLGRTAQFFESLPGFAAAVIIAHLAPAPQTVYVAFYLADKSTLRSSAQFVSLGCVLGLFIVAGLGSNE